MLDQDLVSVKAEQTRNVIGSKFDHSRHFEFTSDRGPPCPQTSYPELQASTHGHATILILDSISSSINTYHIDVSSQTASHTAHSQASSGQWISHHVAGTARIQVALLCGKSIVPRKRLVSPAHQRLHMCFISATATLRNRSGQQRMSYHFARIAPRTLS